MIELLLITICLASHRVCSSCISYKESQVTPYELTPQNGQDTLKKRISRITDACSFEIRYPHSFPYNPCDGRHWDFLTCSYLFIPFPFGCLSGFRVVFPFARSETLCDDSCFLIYWKTSQGQIYLNNLLFYRYIH